MTGASEDTGDAAAAAFGPLGTLFRDAVQAQERALTQAQNWSVDAMAAYREQVEDQSALLRSMSRSLEAMEALVESQTRATQALGESLDAFRELGETLVSSHQRGLDRLDALVRDVVDQVGGQLQAFRPPADAAGPVPNAMTQQSAAYVQATQDWMEALTALLGGKRG